MPYETNISKMLREIDYLSKAVFTDVGEALAEGLMEEFEQLVQETAQWTGTAAASWNISLGGDSSTRVQPEIKNVDLAHYKGHEDAVNQALSHNYGALKGLSTMGLPGQKGNHYRAIMVENYAETAEFAEHGPLRDVNMPSGAAFRFEQRVANKAFEIIRSRKI